MKILYICGVTPEYPAPLHPLPPLDSGSPHSMIFRLVEHLAQSTDSHNLQISVVSAISPEQETREKELWPDGSYRGDYHWSVISPFNHKLSGFVMSKLPLAAPVLQRIIGAHSLQAAVFTRDIRRFYEKVKPDIVILDTAPQFIRILDRFIPRNRLVFYCRADMGASRRFLNIPKLILTMDAPLSDWIHEINPNASPCVVVHDSLPENFSEAKWTPERFKSKTPTVLFVGRIAPEKGLEYLIQAFAQVHSTRPDARLVIAGAEWAGHTKGTITETEYGRKVRAMAEKLPPDSVEWKGWLNIDGLVNEYQNAYMAVYPSTWVEGFGMVASEAMAFGIPVIASKSPGFQAQLEKGGGILIDNPKDIDTLKNAILRLLNDPELAENLGNQGFLLAREYTVERTAENFINAIKSLQ